MQPAKKTKEELLAALSNNMPQEIIEAEVVSDSIIKSNKPDSEKLAKDSEEDYEFIRDHIKKLIVTSDDAIGTMLNLATDAEHPRAFEVLANLFKTKSDIINQLLTTHKDRKKLHTDTPKKGEVISTNTTTTNNAIFVGTTSDLQKYLNDRKNVADSDNP